MKTFLLLVAGVLAGGAIAYVSFASLFNIPKSEAIMGCLLPLGFAAITSFSLTLASPHHWKILAIIVALPTIIISVMLQYMLWMEGRYDISWIALLVSILGICLISSRFALRIKNKD